MIYLHILLRRKMYYSTIIFLVARKIEKRKKKIVFQIMHESDQSVGVVEVFLHMLTIRSLDRLGLRNSTQRLSKKLFEFLNAHRYGSTCSLLTRWPL
jgi:hypothetical protein